MQPTVCPRCGTTLPPDAPAGACPKCLLEAGIDASGGDPTVISSHDEGRTASLESASSSNGLPEIPLTGTKLRYFGDYELLEELARGGMGVVYKARQTRLNRTVALKMILAGQFASRTDIDRFHAEAEAAAQLDHPGIVPIFEVGEHNGHHFFSMALVDGDSLADRIANGPLSPQDAAALLKEVAQAVCYAHGKGVIHRDLKPANILIDQDGQPRVTDFGLAKQVGNESELTATGQIMGTPSYMSPEQAVGQARDVGHASDLYSLGAILYSMLMGHPPFVALSPLEVIQAVINEEPVSPRKINKNVPRDLEMICLKCLQKRAKDRYASVQDLVDDLGRFLNGEPVRARPLSTLTRWYRWCDHNIGRFTSIAIVFALLLPIAVNVWLAYLFGRWTWELIGFSYGFMLMMSAPYILMMLFTYVREKRRRQANVSWKGRTPTSLGMIGMGGVLIAVAVGGYIYVLSQFGWAVPKNAQLLPLLAIGGIGLVIRGLGIRR